MATNLSLKDLQNVFQNNNNSSGGPRRPNNYYPFWNMQTGQQCTVRFLPDANEDNPMAFMVEKAMHTLYINGEKKSVPCLRMYDGEDNCPICKVSQSYYKENDKVNGKKYWRKKQHLTQALIVEDPLPEDTETGETHEGKVRFLALGFQIFKIIKDAIESGELDDVPFAYEGGCDFIIKKTQQGEYPSYVVGTKFARKTRDLTEDEIAHAEENMVDLSTLLPQNPGFEKVRSMLSAALSETGDEPMPAPKQQPEEEKSTKKAETPDDDDADDSSNDDSSDDDDADEILQQIRQRMKKDG